MLPNRKSEDEIRRISDANELTEEEGIAFRRHFLTGSLVESSLIQASKTTMKSKYEQLIDGIGSTVKNKEKFKLACCDILTTQPAQAVNPAAICSACGGGGYEESPYHPLEGPPCKVCQTIPAASAPKLETSDVKWEYEDQLPEMSDDDFAEIFRASRVDGVRLYPYVEDSNGNRVWITHHPEPND